VSSAYLRILFEKPGFFVGDVPLTVTFDGQIVHQGGFMGGFDRTEQVPAGPHVITTRIELGPIARTKEYRFTLDGPADYRTGPDRYEARLVYSRFWGNFTGKLKLVRV
jgi:hypothetical protein